MASIKLKSLNFELPPFRKLGGLTINFAERITIVAGHNGIGKSTILGLVANGSGLTDAAYQSYFNRAFVANLNEIVHLDYEREFEEYKKNNNELPSPFTEYEIDGEILRKRCSITGRTARREVRVVPRNSPHNDFPDPESEGSVKVGKDAKVPLPTLYLGMTRMLPVGETEPALVTSAPDDLIHKDDAAFIESFVDDVISSKAKTGKSNTITTQSIKGTKKTAKHPAYPYSTKCISLGQDSLGTIATALASFKKLQREWADYPGGLLIIDEIDAGFHPHAQRKLIRAIANAAKKLHLQVLATTHSVSLIETIHPDANPIGASGKHVDAVIYLTDTLKPRIADDYALVDIQRDMSLVPPPVETEKPPAPIKVYLEDAEGHYVLKKLLTAPLKRRVKREAGVSLKPIPISVGSENLKGLYKHDPYFRTVMLMLDADVTVKGTKKATQNIVKLPGAIHPKTKKGLSPEATIYGFVETLTTDDHAFELSRTALKKMKVTSDYLREHLLDDDVNINDRVSAKKWMNRKLEHIERWRLVELWLAEHPQSVVDFEESLIQAAVAVAKLNQ